MTAEIPEPFKWDATFQVFYETLDEEHRGLFDGIFKVATHRGDAGALSSLLTAVKNHFATEEGMMTSANFGEFPGHKKAHDDFVAKLSSLSVPVSDETVHFAKNWLVQHIKGTDFKYKGKL
uniref:Hemerythrin n=1 Tax=Aulodrilus japonicus TaxID=2020002 RepID=A0A286MJS1_9ANNE|nr:hemerythrin [Aulodrilus japonicus]